MKVCINKKLLLAVIFLMPLLCVETYAPVSGSSDESFVSDISALRGDDPINIAYVLFGKVLGSHADFDCGSLLATISNIEKKRYNSVCIS
jgi:hypothetical protein